MVESERAKLGTGVRFTFTALGLFVSFSMSWFSGEERGLQNRASGFDSRLALSLSLSLEREFALDA